ncbi:MAG: hypothetical protein ACR2PL_17750 [Dehalococcoidia bacterium]
MIYHPKDAATSLASLQRLAGIGRLGTPVKVTRLDEAEAGRGKVEPGTGPS